MKKIDTIVKLNFEIIINGKSFKSFDFPIEFYNVSFKDTIKTEKRITEEIKVNDKRIEVKYDNFILKSTLNLEIEKTAERLRDFYGLKNDKSFIAGNLVDFMTYNFLRSEKPEDWEYVLKNENDLSIVRGSNIKEEINKYQRILQNSSKEKEHPLLSIFSPIDISEWTYDIDYGSRFYFSEDIEKLIKEDPRAMLMNIIDTNIQFLTEWTDNNGEVSPFDYIDFINLSNFGLRNLELIRDMFLTPDMNLLFKKFIELYKGNETFGKALRETNEIIYDVLKKRLHVKENMI